MKVGNADVITSAKVDQDAHDPFAEDKTGALSWYDPETGRFTLVADNFENEDEMRQHLLTMGSLYDGLHSMFGRDYERFLYDVFAAADEPTRREIVSLARGRDFDFRTATEEYLSSLAEEEQPTNDLIGSILADATLDDKGRNAAIKAVCGDNTRDNYTCWLIPVDHVETELTDKQQDEEVVAVVETENADGESMVQPATTEVKTEASPTSSDEKKNTKKGGLAAFFKKLFV